MVAVNWHILSNKLSAIDLLTFSIENICKLFSSDFQGQSQLKNSTVTTVLWGSLTVGNLYQDNITVMVVKWFAEWGWARLWGCFAWKMGLFCRKDGRGISSNQIIKYESGKLITSANRAIIKPAKGVLTHTRVHIRSHIHTHIHTHTHTHTHAHTPTLIHTQIHNRLKVATAIFWQDRLLRTVSGSVRKEEGQPSSVKSAPCQTRTHTHIHTHTLPFCCPKMREWLPLIFGLFLFVFVCRSCVRRTGLLWRTYFDCVVD